MDYIQRSDVLLIFTYAPAGLGHLRVTDALYDGLNKQVNSVLLGADDSRITFWHRVTSISPFFKRFMDWMTSKQNGYWFYAFYIWLLKITTKRLYQQMEELIVQQKQKKKTVVVVATHFGLAHQIAAIKDRLEKNLKINLVLVVQVTDATSIEVWYVPGATLISVPSEKVKTELRKYAEQKNLKKTNIIVLPYPINPTLGKQLSPEEYKLKINQYRYESGSEINIVIPISGAAVGLDYYQKLICELKKKSDKFKFFVVVKNNVHTKDFIKKMKTEEKVVVIENSKDRKVVDDYQKLYLDEIIALEIVKPSEQSFKTLFTLQQRGGAILLLNKPVGRQEQDNLNFLIEHGLMPSENIFLNDNFDDKQLNKVDNWRAIRLSDNPSNDSKIIDLGIRKGLFEKMSQNKVISKDNELASNGVEQLWKEIDNILNKKSTA